jgi:HEAT repeat protein
LQAVQALGAVKFKDAVPELARLVDDESAPPLLVKKAVVALGQIRDLTAVPALQHALVLERQGVSFLPEASYAIFLFGKDAVDPMIRLEEDKDSDYLAWAKENSRAPAGTYARAALVLGDLGDARAVPVLLEKLKYKDPDPSPGTARILSNLVRQSAADALGRLRAKQAVPAILALVQTRDPLDFDLVAASAEALVWIGDRAQAKELARRAELGDVQLRLVAGRAAALLGDESLRPAFESIGARARKEPPGVCEKQVQDLQLAAAKGAPCDIVGAQFEALSAPVDAAKACTDSASCWMEKLKDRDALVRTRAAYELGRMRASESVPALVPVAGDPDPGARRAAIRALEWLIPEPAAQAQLKAASGKLADQLASEPGREQFIKANEELRKLQTRLAHL